MLAETARLGGDLLIKGAYTQSRLRQMIFGGATSHILSKAQLPVFIAIDRRLAYRGWAGRIRRWGLIHASTGAEPRGSRTTRERRSRTRAR